MSDSPRRSSSRRRRSRSRSREKSGSRDRRSRRRSRSRSPYDPEAERLRKMQEAEREANKDEYTVFVAQIHPKVDERDLFEFFSHVGRVEDIRLIRDQRTQKSKGLCYVEFWEKDSVGKAVTLTGQLLGGYPITISITQSFQKTPATQDTSMRLYVSQLHENVTDSDLRPIFDAFGELDFIDLHRGYGYVQYKSESDARAAIEALNGLDIAGKAIKVSVVDNKADASAGELDEGESGGFTLNAAGRAQLMAKLGRGTAMPTIPGFETLLVAPPPQAPYRPSGLVAQVPIQPSACVVIKNMFDPKTETEPDFDLDIKEDVEEEAQKFGVLKHIHVDKTSAGHVYLRYRDVEGGKKLVQAFNGRWFASRQIVADFVPEATYTLKFPNSK